LLTEPVVSYVLPQMFHVTSAHIPCMFYQTCTYTATGSTPTGAGGEITFINVGVPILVALVTAAGTILSAIITRYVCCRNKSKCCLCCCLCI